MGLKWSDFRTLLSAKYHLEEEHKIVGVDLRDPVRKKMEKPFVVAIGFLLPGAAMAWNPVCGDACVKLAKAYIYPGCGKGTASCLCKSPEFLGSLALCISDHCNQGDWDWAVNTNCDASTPLADVLNN